MILNKIVDLEAKIAVVGLGYVGLPIALAFAKKAKVIGFDISSERVALLRNQIDPSNELESGDFLGCDIHFTDRLEDIKEASIFIVAVPTPIDIHKKPDLAALMRATSAVGSVLKQNDIVVYESTVYPGCTEEDCVPILEEKSNLNYKADFKVAYSPERINPGDKEHTLDKIVKVVSACDAETLETVAELYSLVVSAGVYKAESIKVAEAAKVIENTQRDVNIALMNEFSMIFDKMNINTYEVLKAAGTKWNFLKFFPGLVGGHCIGVDPYYLTYKAETLGHNPKVILSGREINDGMGAYIAKNTIRLIINSGKDISKAKVIVMGATFKEDVSDIRNSKVVDVISELKSFSVRVDVIDPHACSKDLLHEYGFELTQHPATDYDAIVVAVNHKEYLKLNERYFRSISKDIPIVVDVKGIYNGKLSNLNYWSL